MMATNGTIETFGLSLNHRLRPNSPVNSSYTTDTGRKSLRTILSLLLFLIPGKGLIDQWVRRLAGNLQVASALYN